MNITRYFIFFVALFLFLGCKDENEASVPMQSRTTTIQVNEKVWSYLNLEKGIVVGTSKLGDEQADAEWNNRLDWDIAFCGDMVRTNGGTSGKGEGGLQVIHQSYEMVEEAPLNGYQKDEKNVELF